MGIRRLMDHTFAGLYGGIVIPAARIRPVELSRSRKGVLRAVATGGVKSGAPKGLGFGESFPASNVRYTKNLGIDKQGRKWGRGMIPAYK